MNKLIEYSKGSVKMKLKQSIKRLLKILHEQNAM